MPPKLPLKLDVLVPSVASPPKLPPSLGCSPVGFTGVVVELKSDDPDVGLALSAVVVTPGAAAVVGAVVDPVVAVVEVPSPPNPPDPPRLNAGLLVVVVVVVDSANATPPSVNAGFTSAGLVVIADKPVVLPTLNILVALDDPKPVAGAVVVVVVVTVAAGAVIVCVVAAPRLKPLNPVEMGAFTGVVVEAGVVAAAPRLNPPKPVVDGGLATAAVVAVVVDDVSAPKLGVEFEEKPPKPAGFGAVTPAVEAPNKDVVA